MTGLFRPVVGVRLCEQRASNSSTAPLQRRKQDEKTPPRLTALLRNPAQVIDVEHDELITWASHEFVQERLRHGSSNYVRGCLLFRRCPSSTSINLHGTRELRAASLASQAGGLEASAVFQWRATCPRTVCLPQPWPAAEIVHGDCGRQFGDGAQPVQPCPACQAWLPTAVSHN